MQQRACGGSPSKRIDQVKGTRRFKAVDNSVKRHLPPSAQFRLLFPAMARSPTGRHITRRLCRYGSERSSSNLAAPASGWPATTIPSSLGHKPGAVAEPKFQQASNLGSSADRLHQGLRVATRGGQFSVDVLEPRREKAAHSAALATLYFFLCR